ncbi:DUF6636 domain-containing protein [Cellulomonas fengjieae]|uniref:Ig-like domain-containing protein n=1 Tax=Cellulomonas fengjieae TaxID=2819978 RepID=A0ABS3SFM2_9CELL|nr:DUF6636 domain-containing protein [Cellulomonas fengjieae]MBO3084553.1 hypothetical protein [Cellulomonas fengjieae]QVI67114.1 hypothetical protein KG102_05910 [Cellulomonas fengjieae]
MTSARNVRLFVIIDVVLVVLLAVLAVVFFSGGDGAEGAGDEASATASASSRPSSTASATSTEPVEFASPTGNIACTMSVDGVTCTIASYTYAPPVVDGCSDLTGHVLALNADGVAFECVSGPPPAVAGDDVPVLQYGETTSVGDYTCRSATDGVQCTDASDVGFRLARASWAELPA